MGKRAQARKWYPSFSDIHKLFDTGYVTITTGQRFEVSRRIHDEFDNGEYYLHIPRQEATCSPEQAISAQPPIPHLA